MVKLVAFVGPSGTGKTTLIRACGFKDVLGTTTRAPRPNEDNYVYLTVDEFEKARESGDYRNATFYAGNNYGISNAVFDSIKQAQPGETYGVAIDLVGVKFLRSEFTAKDLLVILLYTEQHTIKKRLIERFGPSSDDLVRARLLHSYTTGEFEIDGEVASACDVVVKNTDGDIDDTVARVNSLIKKQ